MLAEQVDGPVSGCTVHWVDIDNLNSLAVGIHQMVLDSKWVPDNIPAVHSALVVDHFDSPEKEHAETDIDSIAVVLAGCRVPVK